MRLGSGWAARFGTGDVIVAGLGCEGSPGSSSHAAITVVCLVVDPGVVAVFRRVVVFFRVVVFLRVVVAARGRRVVLAIVDLPFLVVLCRSPLHRRGLPEGYCQLREQDVTNRRFVHRFCTRDWPRHDGS